MQTHFPPTSVAASWQALGNGYRIYNPALMRFHSPDAWSPFGKGGPNAYAYAMGDPVNHLDPSGHFVVHVPQLLALIAISVASLGAAGIAVNTTNDTQRVLSSIASVLAGVGALAMGRHIYRKGHARPPARGGADVKERNSTSATAQSVTTSRTVGTQTPSPAHSEPEAAAALLPPTHSLDPGFGSYGWTRTAVGPSAPSMGDPQRIRVAYGIRGQGH